MCLSHIQTAGEHCILVHEPCSSVRSWLKFRMNVLPPSSWSKMFNDLEVNMNLDLRPSRRLYFRPKCRWISTRLHVVITRRSYRPKSLMWEPTEITTQWLTATCRLAIWGPHTRLIPFLPYASETQSWSQAAAEARQSVSYLATSDVKVNLLR
jgi:hypothetical protein